MKKTKIKPHVHKVKGARNYALYDILKGNFYVLTPAGDVEELKKSLKDAGLTFETEGTVPFKTTVDMSLEKEAVKIRELQIRLNGKRENNCRDRQFAEQKKRSMSHDTLLRLREELTYIPVKKIHIEAETDEPAKIDFILKKFPYEEASVIVREGLDEEKQALYRENCRDKNISVTSVEGASRKSVALKVEIYEFFYSQHFNPCLGQQVAVDCGGEIRPCLWHDNVLGTVGKDNLKAMIISEMFSEYWELTKDKISVCKDCELRYACPDCRVSTGAGKPSFCNYDPYTGDYTNVVK